jgi:hypothetical protein
VRITNLGKASNPNRRFSQGSLQYADIVPANALVTLS